MQMSPITNPYMCTMTRVKACKNSVESMVKCLLLLYSYLAIVYIATKILPILIN